MTSPRSGRTEKVQFRLPVHILERIDALISEDGEYSTRSEFFRHLAESYFSHREVVANLDDTIQSRIQEGRYDSALSARIARLLADQLLKK
jgi:Arc/MetJ-type ribon-helix-helix transcriptional regulator